MKKLLFLMAGLAFFSIQIQSQTVIDYDGNAYDTVMIGTQAWLKENLKVTHYNNGDPIPNVTDNSDWASLTTGARCYYDNDSAANDSVYGPLYNWYAVNNVNNICPSGWHVSTNTEWHTAEAYLGSASFAGGKMKEAGTLHWTSPNVGATNSTGYTGLPGGMRDAINNTFRNLHENGLWWTSTAYGGSMAWSTYMWNAYTGIDHNPGTKKYGFSIRCVEDLSTGLGKIDYPKKFKLYPNPSKEKITIECVVNQNEDLFIYNLLGEIVIHRLLTKNPEEIDIHFLLNGIYILKVNSEHGTMQQKLIKE